jgi:ferrous iron transport protein A
VSGLNTRDAAVINRLLAMGISPGVTLHLEQQFPSYVIRVGRSRAALDRAIAQTIEVQPHPSHL